MKRIAIDMDEVIADFIPKHLGRFNGTYNKNITIEELRGYYLEDLRPHLRDEIWSWQTEPAYFRDLPVMKDSQEVIKALSERYEIFITTAAMYIPASFSAKYEWLKEHFSFLNEMNFVFCGDKSIIQADYLIDDHSHHFTRFAGQGILFTSPRNWHETGYVRVNNWKEVADYFLH